MDFLHDLRSRVIGQPEISARMAFIPTSPAIRDAFGDSASHGVIVKTYSVTHLVKEAQGRYSPAAVVAVSREVVSGDPDQYVSTSYVKRREPMRSVRFCRFNVAGRDVLSGIARYYFALYGYYGGGRVAALRFLYQMRYAVGLYDHAMRGAVAEGIADRRR